mgnify:CR=1 FL=1
MKRIDELIGRTEDELSRKLSRHDRSVQLNMNHGLLGQRTKYRVTLSKQMTLEDFDEDSKIDHSFFVYDVVINPRTFKKSSPVALANLLFTLYKRKREIEQ